MAPLMPTLAPKAKIPRDGGGRGGARFESRQEPSQPPPPPRRHYTPPRTRPSPHAAALSPPPAPRYILTAVVATLHTHGRHYTPPRSLPSPHAADMPHAVAQLNMARMLHVLCTVSRDHCTVRVCCRFSVLYDLS